MSTIRQLAAILFADIEGFTAMMQTDEFLAMQWPAYRRCNGQ